MENKLFVTWGNGKVSIYKGHNRVRVIYSNNAQEMREYVVRMLTRLGHVIG